MNKLHLKEARPKTSKEFSSPLKLRIELFGIAALPPLTCFGWLVEMATRRPPLAWDIAVLTQIHRFASPALDNIMLQVTRSGAIAVVIVLVTLVALRLTAKRDYRNSQFLVRSIAGAAVLGFLAKNIVQRERPHFWDSLAPENDFGFPSGHAVGTFAFVLSLTVITWNTRWRWLTIVAGAVYVMAVGLSRIYLGVHFPSDVLGGWAISLTWTGGLALMRQAVPPIPTISGEAGCDRRRGYTDQE